ncbi:MAG: hypothetical protein Q8S75_10985 [Nitrospirota bacterium]|nr:hypothetical protein [Nitrospirota bacterium]
MRLARYAFQFSTTCTRNSQPFVAHVTWNPTKAGFDRTYFPISITPTGRFEESAKCTFPAAIGDIIETRRGQSKSRDFRSFNLVSATGYLIMLGMADDVTEIMSIMEYLAGKIIPDQLSKGRWNFCTVTSDWRGTPLPSPNEHQEADLRTNFAEHLQGIEDTLTRQLSQVRALKHDQPAPPPPTPETPTTTPPRA